MSIGAFPKIYTVGKLEVADVLNDEVEITEKLDGSQFAFGMINGQLVCRSKGQLLDIDNPPSLFKPAVNHIRDIANRLPDNYIHYAETLSAPRHNKLKYNNVPINHIALYAIYHIDKGFLDFSERWAVAGGLLEVDSVPVIYKGKASNELLEQLIDRESYLGGAKIEGIVIKNYQRNQFAKLVSDDFKEVRRRVRLSNESEFEAFKDIFKSEARWDKAIQRLREQDKLTGTNKDIGLLCKEVQQDLEAEERAAIEAWLWKKYGKEVIKHSVIGLGNWYQNKIGG